MRHNIVRIHLTDSEINHLCDRLRLGAYDGSYAQRRRLVSLSRQMLMEGSLAVTHPIAREQYIQLSRVASNLNQLAHYANANDFVQIHSMKDILRDLRDALIDAKPTYH